MNIHGEEHRSTRSYDKPASNPIKLDQVSGKVSPLKLYFIIQYWLKTTMTLLLIQVKVSSMPVSMSNSFENPMSILSTNEPMVGQVEVSNMPA